MRHRHAIRLYGVLLALGLTAAPALAQYQPRPINEAPLAEKFVIEVGFGLWNPSADMTITSESLGIVGSQISLVDDLGLTRKWLKDLHITARAARKHKFRFEFIPLDYEQVATLTRDIVFNGQRYRVGLPVVSELNWNSFRYTYEYDFIAMNRGFGGVVVDLRQTNVSASLTTLGLDEFTEWRAPVPSIGGIARVYVVPKVSITGELSFVKIPENDAYDFSGHYFDFNLYGTVNFNRNIGAEFGYRSYDVDAALRRDSGTFDVKGLYFGVVARY